MLKCGILWRLCSLCNISESTNVQVQVDMKKKSHKSEETGKYNNIRVYINGKHSYNQNTHKMSHI